MKSGYFKNYYKGKTKEEIKKSIKDEGFVPLHVQNTKNYEYHPSQHATTKILAFLAGTMDVRIGNKIYHCAKDDKLVIGKNMIHTSLVGKNGCEFFWAKKLT